MLDMTTHYLTELSLKFSALAGILKKKSKECYKSAISIERLTKGNRNWTRPMLPCILDNATMLRALTPAEMFE